jgi:hypothetical protein
VRRRESRCAQREHSFDDPCLSISLRFPWPGSQPFARHQFDAEEASGVRRDSLQMNQESFLSLIALGFCCHG